MDLKLLKRRWKKYKYELANKLVYYPMLRLILFNKWFRIAVVAFFCCVILGLISIPKIWRVTPRGFSPVIKISIIDYFQARSLKRTADQAMKAGLYNEAFLAYRSAFANNPSNPDFVRGILNCYSMTIKPGDDTSQLLGYIFWLLRIGNNNAADCELISSLFYQLQMHDQIRSLLQNSELRTTPKLKIEYVKSLFNTGKFNEFNEEWNKLPSELKSIPEVNLYRQAWLATFGSAREKAQASIAIEELASKPELKLTALRLKLVAAFHQLDIKTFESCFNELCSINSASYSDHLNFWRLLGKTGQKEKAIALAMSDNAPKPFNGNDATKLAQTLIELGLKSDALKILDDYSKKFGNYENLWLFYSELLMEEQLWSQLLDVALKIRQQPKIRLNLISYSFYIEGLAEIGLNRLGMANEAFKRMTEFKFYPPALIIPCAKKLLALNQINACKNLLQTNKEQAENSVDFWKIFTSIAMLEKNTELLLTASEKAYLLAPDDLVTINNRAAALLISRENPNEAVKLTFLLLQHNPDSVITRINHAIALAQNSRASDAYNILSTIDESALSQEIANSYYLAKFDVCRQLNQIQDAKQIAKLINTDPLFQPQKEWLTKTLKTLQTSTTQPTS